MRTPAGEQRDHSGQAKFRRKQTPTLKQALEKEGAIYASKIITGPLDGSCASWWSFIRPEDRCLLMSTDKATNTLHRESTDYRDAVKRKINAYHVFIHAGVVSQRLLQYLAANVPKLVWTSFGSWLRTIGPGIAPSELIVAIPHYATPSLNFSSIPLNTLIFAKFNVERQDPDRLDVFRIASA